MARLLGDLIDVASIGARRLAVVLQRRDVAEVVRETEDAFKPMATEKNIRCAHRSARVRSSRASITNGSSKSGEPRRQRHQVHSARRTSRPCSRARGDDVRFTVSDTGPRIAPDELRLVFDRFWRSRKGDALGLGLGLYISKYIIDAHGGRIWAENRSARPRGHCCTLRAPWTAALLPGRSVEIEDRCVSYVRGCGGRRR